LSAKSQTKTGHFVKQGGKITPRNRLKSLYEKSAPDCLKFAKNKREEDSKRTKERPTIDERKESGKRKERGSQFKSGVGSAGIL